MVMSSRFEILASQTMFNPNIICLINGSNPSTCIIRLLNEVRWYDSFSLFHKHIIHELFSLLKTQYSNPFMSRVTYCWPNNPNRNVSFVKKYQDTNRTYLFDWLNWLYTGCLRTNWHNPFDKRVKLVNELSITNPKQTHLIDEL